MLLQKLYTNFGARTFWVHNTGPIGCLPYVLTYHPVSKHQRDSAGCSKPHNAVSKYFNLNLKQAIKQLRKDLPLAAITLVDIYSAKYSLYKEPIKYGIHFTSLSFPYINYSNT